jgi:hypothetical protein
MMPHPFDIEEAIFPAYALWETVTPLVANAQFEVGPIDVIDMLPVATTGRGPGGPNGIAYTYYPAGASDSRHRIYYAIRAETADGAPAPGELFIWTVFLDPVTATFGTVHILHRIVYSGPQFQFYAFPPVKPLLCGVLECEARLLGLWYVNGAVDQTEFFAGVYVRSV